jgi:hypothetical protein
MMAIAFVTPAIEVREPLRYAHRDELGANHTCIVTRVNTTA